MRTVNVVPIAISVVALFVALGGTGYALVSSDKSPPGVIHACVDNKTGVVRIARGAQACQHPRHGHPGERVLTWSQIGPSDAYYASGRDSNGNVSVKVPPGDYIATGGCTASLLQAVDSTALVFGMAQAALTTDPDFFMSGAPVALSHASVPNAGSRPTAAGPGDGSASLSSSDGFHLPHGGRIFESCTEAFGVHGSGGSNVALMFEDQYVTAMRVGDLHRG
jgi:hypothetical protein